MTTHVRNHHQPVSLIPSSTIAINTPSIGGIFCTGAGTFSVSGFDDQGVSRVIVAFTGVANTWYDLPFFIGANGGTITTGVGAAGTLAT